MVCVCVISLKLKGVLLIDWLIFLSFFLGDYKEGYYIGIEVFKDDFDYDKLFYGFNFWFDFG